MFVFDTVSKPIILPCGIMLSQFLMKKHWIMPLTIEQRFTYAIEYGTILNHSIDHGTSFESKHWAWSKF